MIDRSQEFLPHQQPDPTPRLDGVAVEGRKGCTFWSAEVVAVHWRRSAALPLDCIAYLDGRGLREEAKRLGWEG